MLRPLSSIRMHPWGRLFPALLTGLLLGSPGLRTESEGADPRGHPFGSRTFIEAARIAKPSVVNISTTEKVRGGRLPRLRLFMGGERRRSQNYLERFAPDFGSRGRSGPRHSLGSGVIVDSKGYILTNYHVIERASVIKITLDDQTEYDARIVGTDPKTDVALLKIDAGRPLSAAILGDSERVEVGEWVMAIGSPFGLSHTVTVGVVSAKGRVIGSGPLDDYIQTDAYINVGNSGGPMVNARGEVVGLNTAIVAESLGVGFAIPINIAKAILSDLRIYGSARRGWIGLNFEEVTSVVARALSLPHGQGALVSEVSTSGPAALAGVRHGDVILEYNGRRVHAARDVTAWVATSRPGTRARLKLLRKGRTHAVAVDVRSAEERGIREDSTGRSLGLHVSPLTKHLAQRMKLDPPAGAVISSVESGSPAKAGGLQEGDIILEINRNPVQGMKDYRRLLRQALDLDSILFLIRRNRNSFFVVLNHS